MFDMCEVAAHVAQRVANAELLEAPGPHMLIGDLLPPALYRRLLETIPPPDTFDYADKHKQNFEPAKSSRAPAESLQAWRWFEADVIGTALAPLLVERFKAHLRQLYMQLLGPAAAMELPRRQRPFMGRLMLRRPGYQLKPHRDTKIVALTGLVYFARPGDSHDYGTDLYSVEGDRVAPSWKTFYPEHEGDARATLTKSVPFVANSALIFANTIGMAHAAAIPGDSAQTERFAYQFYVGPQEADYMQFAQDLGTENRPAILRPPASAHL